MKERTRSPLPDPRCILALAFYVSISAVVGRQLGFLSMLMLIPLGMVVYMGIDLGKASRRGKGLWQLILAIAILHSVFAPSGIVWLQIGSIPLLTGGGITQGLLVLIRLAVLLVTGMLFAPYRAGELIQGLVQLKLPYELAYMISVGLRFIPMLREELEDSLTALALRGIPVEALSMKQRLKVYTYLMLPMLAGSLHKAKALALSMEMRGFGAFAVRSSYRKLEMQRKDGILLGAVVLLTLITIASTVWRS